MRQRTEWLIVHSAATKPGMDIGATEIRVWHKAKGWRDIGYQFVVRRSGSVELGRGLDDIGAHTVGQNSASVGICLIGGLSDAGEPDANFTPPQYASLEALLIVLAKAYPEAKIRGHRSFAATACPSFDIIAWAQQRGLPT